MKLNTQPQGKRAKADSNDPKYGVPLKMRSHPAFKAAVISASSFDRKTMSGLLTVALLHYMAHLMERGWKSKRAYAWPDRRFKRGKEVA